MEMRSKLLIGSGIIILALIVSVLLQPSPTILVDSHDKSYISLSKEEAVLNYQWKDIYILKDDSAKTIASYQIISHPSERVNYYVYTAKMPEVKDSSFSTVAELMFFFTNQEIKINENKSIAIDTISKLSYHERKAIFKNADNFEGRRYIEHSNQSSDWFSRIDDSILIFILLAIIPFLILSFQDLILYLTKAKSFSNKYYGWQIFLLLLTMLFFFNMVTPVSYAANNLTAFLKYVFLFFSIYFIYQYLIKHILRDEKAYKKAIILFALCIVFLLVSNFLARLMDQYLYGSDFYTLLAQKSIYFELGLLFSFVLGNFLNNLRGSYFKHRRRSNELESTQEKVLASEAALNSIQASVNPHFLYNSLNAIAGLAKSDPDKTEAMALALSKFYKYQTNRTGEVLSTLAEELEMLESYLRIENIRFGDRLQYTAGIDEASKSKKVPHFLLQPLLENAVKYGYNTAIDKINISLVVKSEGSDLWIRLYDDGSAFSEDLDSGYGLKSVMKKLHLFYPDRHSIDFVNAPKKHVAIRIQNA